VALRLSCSSRIAVHNADIQEIARVSTLAVTSWVKFAGNKPLAHRKLRVVWNSLMTLWVRESVTGMLINHLTRPERPSIRNIIGISLVIL
jgi:hypothetical protein